MDKVVPRTRYISSTRRCVMVVVIYVHTILRAQATKTTCATTCYTYMYGRNSYHSRRAQAKYSYMYIHVYVYVHIICWAEWCSSHGRLASLTPEHLSSHSTSN